VRCPTEHIHNRAKKLELQRVVKENKQNNSLSKDNFASIDLDKELLDTKSRREGD
jgi:hypothetical protein